MHEHSFNYIKIQGKKLCLFSLLAKQNKRVLVFVGGNVKLNGKVFNFIILRLFKKHLVYFNNDEEHGGEIQTYNT